MIFSECIWVFLIFNHCIEVFMIFTKLSWVFLIFFEFSWIILIFWNYFWFFWIFLNFPELFWFSWIILNFLDFLHWHPPQMAESKCQSSRKGEPCQSAKLWNGFDTPLAHLNTVGSTRPLFLICGEGLKKDVIVKPSNESYDGIGCSIVQVIDFTSAQYKPFEFRLKSFFYCLQYFFKWKNTFV
jgi:hypothetical protein